MRCFIRTIIAVLTFFSFFPVGYGMENAFYILHSEASTQHALPSLKNHFKAVNILISQAYQVNEKGIVTGFVNEEILNFANKNHLKVMILVTNSGFDQKKAEQFLADKSAQKKAIDSILDICNQHHYYGVQFDFENIPVEKKAALTHFYTSAADALHKKSFTVSFAVVPVVNDGIQQTLYLKRKYKNWGGAYDLKALGKIGDFISIMAYDQHESGTTPGPIAGIRWVDATIHHALQFVPGEKISLGIPVYSGYWSMNSSAGRVYMGLTDVSYKEVGLLLNKYHAKLHWDENDKVHYSMYEHGWLNEYIFAEDAESFQAKLKLAKKYHLRGISVFNLGNEDPKIWRVLKA